VTDALGDNSETGFQLLGLPVVGDGEVLRAREPFELLASQFVEELRGGGRPLVEQYARRFPVHAVRIREVFPVLAMLEGARLSRESRAMRRNMPGSFPFSRLGQCELLREVGRGGMGVVFRARDLQSGHTVALKVLPWRASLAPEWVLRFEQEAETARQLHHPHIVPVFRWGQDNGYSFLVMQFIRGVGLDRVIEFLGGSTGGVSPGKLFAASEADSAAAVQTVGSVSGGSECSGGLTLYPTSWDEFVRITLQAAQALRGAHQAGICHNDIKPGNLLLEPGGHVWVADFGLSQPMRGALSSGIGGVSAGAAAGLREHRPLRSLALRSGLRGGVRGRSRSSISGGVCGGTLRYMAPERFTGVSSAAADVYSLGATLYELSLQCALFDHDDGEVLRELILREAPVSPRDLCREYPVGLETIVLNCLQKRVEDRYGTADALLGDLLRLTHGGRIRSTRRSRMSVWFGGLSGWMRGAGRAGEGSR
jgi:serine/threonine-protein kinase